MKQFSLLLSIVICSLYSFGQTYGNEWIEDGQSYYKFRIGTDGLYRINYQTLNDVGLPLASINPQNIDIFLNGSQVKIFVSGEQDGTFDPTDYIEFVGKANDGTLDKDLYKNPNNQTNPYESLYADSSVYFLTWSNSVSAHHIATYTDPNFVGKTKDDYFIHTIITSYKDDYFEGIPSNNNLEQQFSEYVLGEGFTGGRNNTFQSYDVPTAGVFNGGPNASIEVLAISRNNPAESHNGFNHSFGVAITDPSDLLKVSEHNGYAAIKFEFTDITFTTSKMSNITRFYMGETDVTNRPLSYHTIPYFKVKYPRQFDLNNASSLAFESPSNNGYYEFTNYASSKSAPIVYDLSNQNRITGDLKGSVLRFNTKGGANQELYIFDATEAIDLSAIKQTQFVDLMAQSADYVIITHKSLSAGASDYKSYRESITGGGHTVTTIYSEDLYDMFYYGYHHPLAIKNGINYLLDQLNEPLENIMLLGKGQVYTNVRTNRTLRDNFDLVPTIGNPPSDYLFVSSIDGSQLSIRVPIGRVAAKSNTDVSNYLAKVMDHESATYAEWHKKQIQIVGGKDANENKTFNGYVDQYYNIAKDTFLGAYRVKFSKNEATTVTDELIDGIQDEINQGANIFNYFGHGSAEILDVNIGDVEDLSNAGRYPLFIFNGCALGNSYVQNSLGEKYIFAKNKGAITWIAGTGLGYTSPLLSYTKILHEELLQNQYGASVGSSIKTTLDRYQNPNDNLNVINCRQLVYQGDPALKIHAPIDPDITVKNPAVSNKFSAVNDIVIDYDIVNLGRTTKDSVGIIVTASNGTETKEVYSAKLSTPNYIEASQITIEKSSFLSGLITFTFIIDQQNEINENAPLGETNNVVPFDHLFELKKPLIIYPLPNAIVNTSDVEFVFQISNADKTDIGIIMEIDSTPKFNSSLKLRKNFVSDKNVLRYSTALPPANNIDLFYRIKTVQDTVESEWSVGSFAYLHNQNSGWSEGHFDNLQNTSLDFMTYDSATHMLNFTRKAGNSISILTNGRFPIAGFNWNWIQIGGSVNIVYNYQPNGVHIMAFHPDTEKRLSKPSFYNQKYPSNPYWDRPVPENQAEYYIANEYTGVYLFRTAEKEHRDSFLKFIKSIPDGYHLVMHNNRITGIEDWEPEIFDELSKFGITGMGVVKAGEPFALFGTKGDPDQSMEKYADYTDTLVPPINQTYEMFFDLFPRSTAGSIITETVGPSSNWNRVKLELKNEDSNRDSFSIAVIGVTSNGNETTLFRHTDSTDFDISNVSANQYPYLKLKLDVFDVDSFTPMNINRWTVHYTGISEGTINIDSLDFISKDTVAQGESISFATVFENISDLTFDPSNAQVKLIHQSGTETIVDTLPLTAIDAGRFVKISDTISTTELSGNYQLFVNANHDQEVLENEYKNNLFYKRFVVTTDVRDPLFDVTFDAYHILNNDLVSGNTLISITAVDENEFLYIDDPALFDIGLRYPGVDTFTPITILDPMFSFNPSSGPKEKAVVNYQTQNLPNGTYTLKVKLMDKSGNGAENPAYTINFKVESKQTITNIYPYPNPFTTCAKFVFTCTGNELPDQMKINIYTITGRLVKQINQDELGTIRIGNNLTDYCWDGTDDYGDKLANGVYLYKAEIRSNGDKVDLSETSSDHLFNNGFGKLYIAR